MLLDAETFKTVVASTPLISMDLVVINSRGQVLLGQRKNRPAQGYWFVPGGRILKGERFPQAFARLTREELGLELSLTDAEFLGPFEHHYTDNFAGADFSTHYVVLGYRLRLDVDLASLPDQQHGRYRWFDLDEARSSNEVHLHTQWYLEC